jgi:16S rRNA G1207 methylase RsmC
MTDERIAELNRQLNELKAEADWYKMHMLNLQRQFDMQQANPPASDALAEVRQLRTEMVQLFSQVLAALETKGGERA